MFCSLTRYLNCRVAVMNEQKIGHSTLVGETAIPLESLIDNNNEQKFSIELETKADVSPLEI